MRPPPVYMLSYTPAAPRGRVKNIGKEVEGAPWRSDKHGDVEIRRHEWGSARPPSSRGRRMTRRATSAAGSERRFQQKCAVFQGRYGTIITFCERQCWGWWELVGKSAGRLQAGECISTHIDRDAIASVSGCHCFRSSPGQIETHLCF